MLHCVACGAVCLLISIPCAVVASVVVLRCDGASNNCPVVCCVVSRLISVLVCPCVLLLRGTKVLRCKVASLTRRLPSTSHANG